MWELIRAFTVELFVIPRHKEDDGAANPRYATQTFHWRLKMVALLLVTAGALSAHLGNVYGFYGESFATTADVKDLRDGLNEIRATAIEQRLERFYTALCANPGDATVLDVIRDLEKQYKNAKGESYKPRDCGLLLKVK